MEGGCLGIYCDGDDICISANNTTSKNEDYPLQWTDTVLKPKKR